jgi:hypothetical protein
VLNESVAWDIEPAVIEANGMAVGLVDCNETEMGGKEGAAEDDTPELAGGTAPDDAGAAGPDWAGGAAAEEAGEGLGEGLGAAEEATTAAAGAWRAWLA